ncbi:casein kinase II regulatory subunit-domain-containing protein [Dipodascopsis uninucleata]
MMEGVERSWPYTKDHEELIQEEVKGEPEYNNDEEEEEEEEGDSYYESGSSRSEAETWISSFCSMRGHEYFAEVTEDFIEDDFNLTGLSSLVPYYKEALDMILDFDPDPESARLPNMPVIENSAEQLYGLIHARFLLTRQGLAIMAEKYDLQHFGTCPRYLCNQTPVLPIGTSDLPGNDTVKLFCPSCADIYNPVGKEENEVDGAFFGTSFAGLFLKTYVEIPSLFGGITRIPSPNKSQRSQREVDGKKSMTAENEDDSEQTANGNNSGSNKSSSSSSTEVSNVDKWQVFQMTLFGFKVSERARSGARMRWLRERPKDTDDLLT